MKFVKILKNGNFWVSLISACVLICQSVFKIELSTEYLNQILLGIMGLLVVFGIISDPTGSAKQDTEKKDTNKNMEIDSMITSIMDIVKGVNDVINEFTATHKEDNQEIASSENPEELQNKQLEKTEPKMEEVVIDNALPKQTIQNEPQVVSEERIVPPVVNEL